MSLISHAAPPGPGSSAPPGGAGAYAVRVDGDDIPRQLYWGRPLSLDQAESLPLPADRSEYNGFNGRTPVGEELPVDGGARFGAPSLQVRFARRQPAPWSGPRGAHADEQEHGATLLLHFRDRHYPRGSPRLPGARRQRRDRALDRAGPHRRRGRHRACCAPDSAAWSLRAPRTTGSATPSGAWAAETQLRRTPLPYGETVLTSRRGVSSHHVQPWPWWTPATPTRRTASLEHRPVLERQVGGSRCSAPRTTRSASPARGTRGADRAARPRGHPHHPRIAGLLLRRRLRCHQPLLGTPICAPMRSRTDRDQAGPLQLLGGHRLRGHPGRPRRLAAHAPRWAPNCS